MAQTGFGDAFETDTPVEATFMWGQVTNNSDPDKLGRVKISIPGKVKKETTWASPIGMPGSGYTNMGAYIVPRVGSLVIVGFVLGDFDQPVYMPGPPAQDAKSKVCGAPKKITEQTAAQAPNVRVIAQTETFEVWISDTDTEKKITLKTLDDSGEMIEIDQKDGSILLSASTSIILKAPMIDINGLNVQIKNRPVSPLGQDI